MYCVNCGAEILENATFCSACGTRIAQNQTQTENFQSQKDIIHKNEIFKLKMAINYFSQKYNQYKAYDKACAMLNEYSRPASKALIIWGCIILTIGLMLCIATLSVQSVVLVLIPGIAMLIGGIFMQVNNRRKYRSAKYEYTCLSRELYKHYASYTNCPVGAEFTNPETLQKILSVLISGRADTIKESINILLSDVDRAQINKYIKSIQKNTMEMNRNTAVSAFFIAARFF